VTSPDAVPFQDLLLYDRNAADLVERAKLDLATKLPGLVLRAGRTEVALLEAEALIAVERIFAINRLPMAVAIIQARLAGVTISEGVAATATATFALADTVGHTIPAGTRLRLDTGTDSVIFTTNAAVTVAAGPSSATLPVTASTVGTAPNGTVVGTALALADPLFFVDGVTLATAPTGGADPENVVEWLTRAGQRFARLTSVLVLPSHFLAATLEDVRVARAFVIDKYDPTTPAILPGTNLGHVTVAVSGSGGVALSAPVKAEIAATLSLLTRADLGVHVVDPTITTVAVTTTVVAKPTYTSAAVIANVTAALSTYLSPDTWAWGSTVYRNELLALIDGVVGVERSSPWLCPPPT